MSGNEKWLTKSLRRCCGFRERLASVGQTRSQVEIVSVSYRVGPCLFEEMTLASAERAFMFGVNALTALVGGPKTLTTFPVPA